MCDGTTQEMLDQVMDFFAIKPDYDLDLMIPGQNLYELTATIIRSLKQVLEELTQIMCLFMEIQRQLWQDLAGFTLEQKYVT